MLATIKQAVINERNLSIRQKGYGHWRTSCTYYGKEIHTLTTNSQAIDDFKSEYWEKDKDNINRKKQGYEILCSEIIRKNKINV